MSKNIKKHSDNQNKKLKDLKFPKSNSFKQDLAQQSEGSKQQFEEERPKTLESMLLDVQRRQNAFEHGENLLHEQEQFSSEIGEGQEKSRKTFYREFKKVVEASDIIIEVLDARDPLGCRCPQVEEAVLTSGKNKKLILLLNKIDLIPRSNLDKWLKYLRNEFPTIAFRASTQNQRDRLGQIKTSIKACDEHLLKSSNKCIGASTLMNLLSNYCRKNDIKTSITVGVVGYPNVGKSSVINSLKRSQACEIGSMPGITKQMQTVKLDKLIRLFDSPGIVMSKENNLANLVLRNCVRIETIENPIPAIELLLHRCTKEQMMLQYDLNDFHDANEFLTKMAQKMGCLKKGGLPDIHKAAQRVLSDWTNGKLTYFTEPPERTHDIISTELVTQMKEAFDIDALLNNEDEQFTDLDNSSLQKLSFSSSNPGEIDLDTDDEETMSETNHSFVEAMEDDCDESTIKTSNEEVRFMVQIPDRSKHLSKQRAADIVDKRYEDEIRRSVKKSNLTRQQEFKKMKKHQKKSEKTMENLGNALDSIIRLTPTLSTNNSTDE